MKNTRFDIGYASPKDRYPNTETLKVAQIGDSKSFDRQYNKYRKKWGKSPVSEHDFPHVPFQIDIDINDLCNLKCYHCFARSTKRIGEKMSEATINSVIGQIKKYPVYALNIGFCSEPTLEIDLVKNIVERIRTAHSVPDLFIHTNGLLLNKDVATFFIEKEVSMVCVSFNAATRDTYKKITGIDCYDSVLNKIRQLKKIRDNSGKRLPLIRISMVILKENVQEKNHFYQIWENIADKIEFQKYKNYGKSKTLPLKNQLRLCPWPFMRMSVWPDGTIGACPNIYSRKEDLALPYNINTDDIREVWNSKELQNIRLKIINNHLKSCCYCQNDCESIY